MDRGISYNNGRSWKFVGKPTQITIKANGSKCLPEIKVSKAERENLKVFVISQQDLNVGSGQGLVESVSPWQFFQRPHSPQE